MLKRISMLSIAVIFLLITPVVFAAGVIKLPQTGQTKCYTSGGSEITCSGTGQDGEVQAGITWPNPRFTVGIGAETDCITDNLTGLMWPKNGNLADATMTWDSAIDYANNLTLCGYSDWRLPNVNELESLVNADVSITAAWLNTQGFINVQAGYYLSSTTLAFNTDDAWIIDMGGGYVEGRYKDSYYLNYVWPVRSGQAGGSFGYSAIWTTGQKTSYRTGDDGDLERGAAWPDPRFTINGDCVTDNLTGLMWSRNANLAALSWNAALNYANNLTLCAYLDWRLPNRKELRSLIDYSRYVPALPDNHPFTNVQYGYWSSTTLAYNASYEWFVGMSGGVDIFYGDSYFVWPVRSGQVGESFDYYCDSDGDAYISPTVSGTCKGSGCVPAGCQTTEGNDCDDNDMTVYPGAPELCDNKNNDCNSSTVDGSGESWYDNPTTCGQEVCYRTGQLTCSGGIQVNTCNIIYPTEVPGSTCNDGIDNDCDGLIDSADSNCVKVIQLPQTGQTKCYDTAGNQIACAGTGQDGEIRAGVPWPNPRFAIGIGAEADCVTDNLTGLMWPKNGNLPNDKSNWGSAIDFSNDLTLCGYSDWRLPNVNELESLVNADVSNTAAWLNSKGFINMQPSGYWSSTTDATDPNDTRYAWYVLMWSPYDDSSVRSSSKGSNYYVWPVRSGQSGGSFGYSAIWRTGQKTSYRKGDDGDLEMGASWPSPRFTDNGDGSVTDNLTSLVWLKNANCISTNYPGIDNDYTWQFALDFVKGINNGTYSQCGAGYRDWRLPNRKELRSLIDYSRYNPALPAGYPFTNEQSVDWYYWYWSSTTNAYRTYNAWTVAIFIGDLYDDIKSESLGNSMIWPVRGGVPELAVTSIGNLPASKKRGSSFTVKDTVMNRGGVATGRFAMRYYLSLDTIKDDSDILLKGSRTLKKVKDGKSSNGKTKVTIKKSTPPGAYYLIVCADDTNKVSESNEADNCTVSNTTINVK